MRKPSKDQKLKVQPKRYIPSLEEIKMEKPIMTDESAAQYRAKLIASGQIKENPGYDGYMSPEETKALRDKLVAAGIIRPGAGMYRLRASQERRQRSFRSRREGRA